MKMDPYESEESWLTFEEGYATPRWPVSCV